MREIKFRGRQNSEWVYGNHYGTGQESLEVFWMAVADDLIDISTVGQFTGLKDKDGEEIWEDSIITFVPAAGFGTKLQQTARVYYCIKRATFCVKSKAWDMPIKFNCDDIEVIGNIHENPELIQTISSKE